MRPLKVLVVEDDLELRMFYQLALMEQGHAVNAVANGAEALDVVSPEIDLVVTDLGMPIMTGDKLIAALRAKPEFRDLPVLVVTAHPGELRAELRNGKTSVLRKPFELDDFIRWVDAAAAQRVRSDN
jgi:two-component system chemotaxis response regulator CheY